MITRFLSAMRLNCPSVICSIVLPDPPPPCSTNNNGTGAAGVVGGFGAGVFACVLAGVFAVFPGGFGGAGGRGLYSRYVRVAPSCSMRMHVDSILNGLRPRADRHCTSLTAGFFGAGAAAAANASVDAMIAATINMRER